MLTSLRSTIYSRIGDPPSDSGGCHASVKEVLDIPDKSNGPRGGDGLSGNIQYIIYLFSYGTVLLMQVSRNTVCLSSRRKLEFLRACQSILCFKGKGKYVGGRKSKWSHTIS